MNAVEAIDVKRKDVFKNRTNVPFEELSDDVLSLPEILAKRSGRDYYRRLKIVLISPAEIL
jgi:hypothetical protein